MRARIITTDGWKTVRCIWRKRGLAVTKALEGIGWTVTHIATGRSIGRWTSGIVDSRTAIALATVLGSAVDWRTIRDPIPNAHQDELGGFVRAALEMCEVPMTSASTKRRHRRTTNPPYSDAPLPWTHRAEKEIQRLRAAMVHAMVDAEWGAKNARVGTVARKRFQMLATRLKTALEKK